MTIITESSQYTIGSTVTATVERVLGYGAFVCLSDGTRAFLRRREIDVDKDLDPRQVLRAGQSIQAVVVTLQSASAKMEVSRRLTFKNPWIDFAAKHHPGDVIQGLVREVQPSGMFVRVSAGIRGFVPKAWIAPWPVESLTEVFAPGDHIEAVVHEIDARNYRLVLNMKARMESLDEYAQTVLKIAGHYSDGKGQSAYVSRPLEQQDVMGGLQLESRSVILVEDAIELSASLATWMEGLGASVTRCSNADEACGLFLYRAFDMAMIDLNLGSDHVVGETDGYGVAGLRVLAAALAAKCGSVFAMSDPETLAQCDDALRRLPLHDVFSKPLLHTEIIERFTEVIGNPATPARYHPRIVKEARQLTIRQILEAATIQTDMHRLLEETTKLVDAGLGALFCVDPVSFEIRLLEQVSRIPGFGFTEGYQSVLSLSPIKDLFEDRRLIDEKSISENAAGRFGKLRELFWCESCIGIPVQIDGDVTHSLFFFHPQPRKFNGHDIKETQSAARLTAALIKEQETEQKLRDSNQKILTGELASYYGHEIANKLSALETHLLNLVNQVSRLPDREVANDTLRSDLTRARTLAGDLSETVRLFHSLSEKMDTSRSVDVNAAISAAVELLRPKARRSGVRILTFLARDPPPLSGNPMMLQQLLVNLILNAVQWVDAKYQSQKWTGSKLVEIRADAVDDGSAVRIDVRDTGPGIHHHLWERIFQPAFSTRGGSGLGLAVAKTFARMLGGELFVYDSNILQGTTFRLILPIK